MSRVIYAIRNITWGLFYKFSTLFLTFLVRTIMIYTLGAEYLGLNSLFTSLLRILSLADLGFASAITYYMYKPIAQGNIKLVCALLKFYRKIYCIIGSVIFLAGLICLPFIRNFIKGEIPSDINIYLLFFIYLLNTSISYMFFSYKGVILIAHQRNDLSSIINMIINIIKNILQIIVLLVVKDYYIYVVLIPIATIVVNILTFICVGKNYPEYTCKGNISSEDKKLIKEKCIALLGVKITGLIYNSIDSVVISSFLGLVNLAKYNNYYYVMDSLIAIIAIIYSSIQSSVGNSIAVESNEKNYIDYMNLSFMNAWLIGWCTVCLYCLYQPFIKIWVGEHLLFDHGIMSCFCIYFYVYQLKIVQSTYKDAAGLWREDMWRSYASNIFNLASNLILVQFIGIYGILLSTILALIVISYPWQTKMIHEKLFQCSMKPYLIRIIVYTFVTFFTCIVTDCICRIIPWEHIGGFCIKIIICCFIPNIIFVCCAFKTREFSIMKKNILKGIKICL